MRNGKQVVINMNEPGAGSKFFKTTSERVGYGRERQVALDMNSLTERDQKKATEKIASKTNVITDFSMNSGTKKKFLVKPPATKKIVEEEESDFSLGGLLKILLIIGIILVLVLLLGGQALQLSKSWEK